MRIAVSAGFELPRLVDFVVEAERLGASSVWMPEVWGADALTPLAYLAARTSSIGLATGIVQLGSRSPALLAMSAMTMQQLSGGRFLLGIGTSGPQVMEGWHGVRFRAPVAATRDTIEIVRAVSRGDRVRHDGRVYQLPLPGGPGRPLRSLLAPVDVPIYVAALGPRNLELTGELADGWLGNAFVPDRADVFLEPLRAGAAAAVATWPSSTSSSRWRWRSPTILTRRPAVTPTATPSPSAPWARRRPTSTTTPSPARASPTTSPPSRPCGSTASATRRPPAFPWRSVARPTCSDRPT